MCSIILVGASSGGHRAMEAVLAALPVDLPVPVVVAQHLPRDDGSRLRSLLARHCTLRVTDAADGEQLEAATVYVVPPGMDLAAESDGRVTLTPCSALPPACPCIDRMFSATAESLGGGVVAVVLSGTGRDGAEGTIAVKRAGGTVIAEDDRTAAFGGMPTAAADAGMVDAVLAAPEIAAVLVELAHGGAS